MLILFDTDCVLCSAGAGFVLTREREPEARFVSAWSDEGREVAARHGLTEADLDRTFLVVLDGRGLTRSDAALAVLGRLKAPWRWLAVLRLVPRPLRDWVYDRIAQNRYRWFGRREMCFVPPPGQAHRFVSGQRDGAGRGQP